MIQLAQPGGNDGSRAGAYAPPAAVGTLSSHSTWKHPMPATRYSHQYASRSLLSFGGCAALGFRLVAHAADGSPAQFRSSGMFAQRIGQWQAFTWQATRVPAVAEQPQP